MRAPSASSRSRARRGSPRSCRPRHRCCMPGSAGCAAGSRGAARHARCRRRGGASLGNAHSVAGLALSRSLTALAAGELDVAVAAARESVELTARAGRRVRCGRVRELALAAALLEAGDPGLAGGGEPAARAGRRPGAPALPRPGFRAQVAGAADALLARARPRGRCATCGALRRSRRSGRGRDAAGEGDGRPRRRRPSHCAPGTRRRRRSAGPRVGGRLRRRRHPDRGRTVADARRPRAVPRRTVTTRGGGARARGVGPPRVRRRQIPQRSRPGAAAARPATSTAARDPGNRPRSAWPP